MRDWESQKLPGLLENDTYLPMSLPSEILIDISERLAQLFEVTIPDWKDGRRSPEENWWMLYTLDVWHRAISATLEDLLDESDVT